MSKFLRLASILLLLLSVSTVKAQHEFGNSRISGDFGFNGMYYIPDSIIGAEKVDSKVRANAFINLLYSNGGFSAGVRYEYYQFPLIDFEKIDYKGQGIKYFFADYKNKFFKLEGFADNGSEKYASDFIDKAKDHGLVAAFMGHAHNVDWTVEYEGVVIGLGVKTGEELYFAHVDASSDDSAVRAGLESTGIDENFDLIGASLVTLTGSDGSFELEHLYFNERTGGDFVRWVKW